MAGAGGGAWLSPPSQRTRAAEIAVVTHAPSHTHGPCSSVLAAQCNALGSCHAYSVIATSEKQDLTKIEVS